MRFMAQSRRVVRVEAAHRFDVSVERGFAFITDTANWSKFWRFEPNRLVTYTSAQAR